MSDGVCEQALTGKDSSVTCALIDFLCLYRNCLSNPVLCYHPDEHNTLPFTCSTLCFVGEITKYSVKGLACSCWSECYVPECSFSSVITSSKIPVLFSVSVYFIFAFVVYLFLFFIAKAWHLSSLYSERKFHRCSEIITVSSNS